MVTIDDTCIFLSLNMYSNLFILFSAFLIVYTNAQSPTTSPTVSPTVGTAETQFCQCSSCCDVNVHNFDIDHNPQYNAFNSLTASNKDGYIYDTVIAQVTAKTVNHYIASLNGEALDCSQSHAYMYQDEFAEQEPLAKIDLVQHNPITCFANFSETANSVELSSGINFYYSFKNLSMTTPASNITLEVFEAEDIIPLDPPIHEFYAKDSAAPDGSGHDKNTELFFEIQTHHRDNSPYQWVNENGTTCTIQNQAGAEILLDFEVIAGKDPCRIPVTWNASIGWSPITIKYQGWMNQNQYELCAAEIYDNDPSNILYVYRVKPYDIGAPGDYCDYDDSYEAFTFNITMDSTLNENSSNEPMEEFQSSIGAFTIDATSCQSASTFLPTALIGFTVTHNTNRTSGFDTVVATTQLVNDVPLILQSTTCSPASGAQTCVHTFQSQDCLPLKINDDGSCEFNFVPYIQTVFDATYVGLSITDTNEILYEEKFDGQTYAASQCQHIKRIVRDLTKVYGTDLTVTGDSLLNDISVEMTLTNVPDDGQITLELQSVDVRLESYSSSDVYQRDFLIDEKVRHMESSVHPYFTDAHFCRKVDSAGVCSDFYARQEDLSNTALDRYTQTSFNALVGGLHPSCPGFKFTNGTLTNQNLDRFTFNPQKYVFKHFKDLSGKLIVDVIGRVRLCTSTTDYQALQDEDIEIVNLVAIIDVSNSISGLLNETGTSSLISQTVTKKGARFSERDTILIAVLSAIVPICAILFCVVAVLLYMWCSKNRGDDYDFVQSAADFSGLSKIHKIKYSKV